MENIYLPKLAKIKNIEEQSPTVKLFRLEPGFAFTPGQFVLAGQIGYGEAPFGPLSSQNENKYIEIAVRKAGVVTNYLHSLKKGDTITLRGPYGNGFPLDFMKGKDIVCATGGCGIPPIASLIEHIIANREKFGRVYLLYGAKSQEEILLKDRFERWESGGIKVMTIAGFVTDLIKEIEIDEANAVAVMCGPGPMMDALEKVLRPLGISDRRIFVSMERKMQCGVGKCQHCTTGGKYVCMDGPVFYYDQIEKNHD